jgi:hypothetical protein
MIPTEQVILAAISLISTVVTLTIGTWAYRVKREADARVKETEASLIKANAALEEIKSDANAMSSVMAALDKQVEINRQQAARDKRWRRILRVEREARRQGYNTIRAVQNDTNTGLVNLYNAVQKQPDIIVQKIVATLPPVFTSIMEQTKAAYQEEMKTLVGELGDVLRQKLALDRFAYETTRFPAADDPEWRDEWITPLTPDLILYRGPFFDSDAQLRKSCAQINPAGEQVKLITGRFPDWLIVKKREKSDDGDMECWGYLPAHRVKVGREETISSENVTP